MLIKGITITDEDVLLFISAIIPEIYSTYNNTIKKFTGYTVKELEKKYLKQCFSHYIYYPNKLSTLVNNIKLNNCKEILDCSTLEECMMTVINYDDELLERILVGFIFVFKNMIVFLVTQFYEIVEENYNNIISSSSFYNDDFFYFIKFLREHGYKKIYKRNIDLTNIIKKFFGNIINNNSKNENVFVHFINIIFYEIFKKVLLEFSYVSNLELLNNKKTTEDVIIELYEYYKTHLYEDYTKGFTDGIEQIEEDLNIEEEWSEF